MLSSQLETEFKVPHYDDRDRKKSLRNGVSLEIVKKSLPQVTEKGPKQIQAEVAAENEGT